MADWLAMAMLCAAFLAAGAFTGLASGALRLGGGMALAPALFHLLGAAGYHGPLLAHLALASALLALAALSLWAAAAQRGLGGVDWAPLRLGAGPAALGGALGGLTAAQLVGLGPMALWGAAAFVAALLMAFGGAPGAWGRAFPEGARGAAIGGALGLLTGGGAVGGAAFAGPLLRRFGADGRAVAALSAGFGAAASLPAAVVLLIAAPPMPGSTPLPFAVVALVGAALAASAATLTAPQGARLAREAPDWALRLGFAFLIAVTALSLVAAAARG